jgi:hypothetical protein
MLQTPSQPSPCQGEGATALVAIVFPLVIIFEGSILTIAVLPSPNEGEGLGVRSAMQITIFQKPIKYSSEANNRYDHRVKAGRSYSLHI